MLSGRYAVHISTSLYGILPSDNLTALKRKFGEPIKVENKDAEWTVYTFKHDDLLIEASILLKKHQGSFRVNEGELCTFSVEKAL